MNVKTIIDSLDTRHHEAQDILHSLADGKKVKPSDIDALNSRFIQVAPLLHKLNEGSAVAQEEIDGLDSFAGERLRNVLHGLASKSTAGKAAARRKVARKK
jgi:hypothetical protein